MTDKPETKELSDIEKAAATVSAGVALAGALIGVGFMMGGMMSRPNSSPGIFLGGSIERAADDITKGLEAYGCLASGRKWSGYSCSDDQ